MRKIVISTNATLDGVVQDPDAPPGTVVEVLRPGYGDGERQLRPAAVTVAKRE